MNKLTRRDMLAASTGLAGFTFLPARVLGRGGAIPPSEKLNIAFVGAGARASYNLRELANLGHNVAAICDVDWRQTPARPNRPNFRSAYQIREQFNQAKVYEDWRIMLQKEEKNIDAVVTGAPDHDHAVASLAAMKLGKAAYAEKPMAHTIEECRAMAAAAKKYKVATQTGCQGHASEDIRNVVEWTKAGAIGDVRECHIWSSNTGGTPYAERQIKAGTARGRRIEYADIARRMAEDHPVPEGLNWDMFLGPAPFRKYNPMYVPSAWRSWRDFGDASIGDMCCHYFDPLVWALDLEFPERVQARTDPEYDWETNKQTYPNTVEVKFDYPARGKKPPVSVTWHYGPNSGTIPLPKYWKDEYWPRFVETGELSDNGGCLMIGTKGAWVFGDLAVSQPQSAFSSGYKPVIWTPQETCKLIPDELNKSFKRPDQTIPRVYNHWADFADSAKARKPGGTHFGWGAMVSEPGLLANIACTQKDKILEYDGKTGRFKNSEEANRLLKRSSYREGFQLTV